MSELTTGSGETTLTKKDKTVSLFQFIKELNQVKQKLVTRVSDYKWWRSVASLPEDLDNIKIYYRDRVEDDSAEENSDILLSVHKPNFQECPKPDSILLEWLEDGWKNYNIQAKVKQFIYRPLEAIQLSQEQIDEYQDKIDEENQTFKEMFDDDLQRVKAYNAWLPERTVWIEKQKLLAKTRNLFSELYNVSVDLERESEVLELIVADGFLRDRQMPELDHPILTRRVKIQYDSLENTVYITDSNVETELYTALFQGMDEVNLSSVNRMRDRLHEYDYHPLDRNDLPVFLEAFVHQLSAESIYSDNGIPEDWQKRERLLLYRNPCYILRKRMDGAIKAIEQIIQHVEETGEVPAPIGDIVDGGKIKVSDDTHETTVEEQLAAVGGESVDILLSKEANKEQLEIARRIEHYNAVLVQGPPGTGKTHTIANLMGHFLAQGKSVLVTSHTKKALSVLKEKVASGLQSLCVSMLEDSNTDMEKSIDGITSYMSSYTSFEVKRDMDKLGLERGEIIRELADVRKKLFSIISQENNSIVYNGKGVSPSEMAAFVQEKAETLSYIPGKVRLYEPLPLSISELTDLYRSNGTISANDESEFENDLPNPQTVMEPDELDRGIQKVNAAQACMSAISERMHWDIQNRWNERQILIHADFGDLTLDYPLPEAVEKLKSYIGAFPRVEKWMQHCAVDGKKGGTYGQLWRCLCEQVQKTNTCAEKVALEKFGKDIDILNKDPDFSQMITQVMEKYRQGGKINKLALLLNKQLDAGLKGATINGQPPKNVEDCQIILDFLELKEQRTQCARYWNDLIGKYDVPQFYDLDSEYPEQVAANYIPLIERYLEWFAREYEVLTTQLEAVGLSPDTIFQNSPLDSDLTAAEKILSAIGKELPEICNVFDSVRTVIQVQEKLVNNRNVLQTGKRLYSAVCKLLYMAADSADIDAYRNAYVILEETYAKMDLENKRKEYISRLAPIAPQWAEAISSRKGIHGESTVPNDIDEAWQWKQYYGIIEEITAEPFGKLQQRSLELSKQYRKTTAEFAEKSAWYHLLRNTEHDINIKQALIGWKQTVKRIGKGTGKNAPMYRAKARGLMAKCQSAVPGWIMPVGKALESLNPSTNRFDIIIIDEASQSDISSLAILYMGKKLIIVGDDKQVSPMAVGISTDKLNSLKTMYIEGKIPNDHLYDGKTSIYDVAATTFQPLMLREHFRCVPEIIGFSNMLSYDFKIKPLRDASSSNLLPAVVNYRVKNGEKVGKVNVNEAKTIVALMKSCMSQPEYAGKTFGVISLLGDDQVKKLQQEIDLHIDTRESNERRILCGNASNFQGDERDVIFLSVVECANGNGPVAKWGYGTDDSYRKRFNVAASRAKDQLWVVDSLDPNNDLKPDDIRKTLIDYSLNPESVQVRNAEIEEKAESPFEASVARYLVAKGFHLVQQWKVGAYRLDMVAVCGIKKVAIECDGERWHSGEDKIREDMERQTILERLGWRFIRIRGSEYYRKPEETMMRVLSKLTELGIEPEKTEVVSGAERETELLKRVKLQAVKLLETDINDGAENVDSNIVQAALDSKGMVWKTNPGKTELHIPKAATENTVERANVVKPVKEPYSEITDHSLLSPQHSLSDFKPVTAYSDLGKHDLSDKEPTDFNASLDKKENKVKIHDEKLHTEVFPASKQWQDISKNASEDQNASKESILLSGQYSRWLNKTVGEEQADECLMYLNKTEDFCIKNEMLDCKIFEITEINRIKRLKTSLEISPVFRKLENNDRYYYFLALRSYMAFLGEISKQKENKQPTISKDKKGDKKKSVLLDTADKAALAKEANHDKSQRSESAYSAGKEDVFWSSDYMMQIQNESLPVRNNREDFLEWLKEEVEGPKVNSYINKLAGLECFCRQHGITEGMFGVTASQKLKKIIIEVQKEIEINHVEETEKEFYISLLQLYLHFLEKKEHRPSFAQTKSSRSVMLANEILKKYGKGSEHNTEVLRMLDKAHVEYIDMRSTGGPLWIIGGRELENIITACNMQTGKTFKFKRGGDKVTKGRDGWWTI